MKCEHNDHSHLLLWAFVIMFFLTGGDCSGQQKAKVEHLELKVQSLEKRLEAR